MSAALDAVTLGEAMVLLLGEPALPLASSRHYSRSVAGAESNVAIGLARLGHRTGFIGRVGTDVFGRVVLSTLRAEGVDVSQLRLDDAPTGLLVRDCAGERPSEVVYRRRGSAGSMLSPEDVQREYVADARLLHVSGITGLVGEHPRAAALKAMRIAADAGALVSFDPNLRERLCPREQAAELLRPLLGEAQLVLAAEDEAVLLSGCSDGEGAAEWLIEHGARMVVIKRGVEGAWATDGAERWDQASWPVRAVDAVGAGDAFAAGFLSALLHGAEPPRALAEGAVVAALCVSAPSDIDGLPTAAERDALLAGGAEVRR
jgi:2-dehydro-3-deoxygluconokinase